MLRTNDIKAELSYAYLHAVSARAGFACTMTGRHQDNAGIDAQIHIKELLHPDARFDSFSISFQLKATSQKLAIVGDKCSYSLDVAQYDKLRNSGLMIPTFMVLFELPSVPDQWLNVTADQWIARKCGRWVSLQGAPPTENKASVAVRFPLNNVLTPEALRQIAVHVALDEELNYEN